MLLSKRNFERKIDLNNNSSTSAPKKIDLENSLQQFFAPYENFWYVDIYVQLLSEGRG